MKVFLTKEDKSLNNLSTIANNYEGQIKQEDCDIVFTIDKNWKNIPNLKELILKKVLNENV